MIPVVVLNKPTRRTCVSKMKSLLLIALVLFSCLFTVVYFYEFNTENDQIGENGENCSLWVLEKIASKMPVPFATDGSRHWIIYPDDKGHLYVEYGRDIQLSCTTGKFVSADFGDDGDVLVSCAGGNQLRYRGRVYEYKDFRCDAMPRSQLKVTGQTCQPENYTVATVGFQTADRFLGLYSVCFDKSTKRSLYSWYEARSPYYDNHQVDSKRPPFAKTKELYGNTDVNKKYTVAEQRKTVAKILDSEDLADQYIKNDNKHSLSRGHYAAKVDFFFAFEQSATFYYANVAPQWQLFNGDLWAELEDKMRRKLARDAAAGNGTRPGRHVVVTGSHGSCTLPDASGVQRPLFLDPPAGVPVPLLYWKLDYDADADDGLVYVGLNDPYRQIDDDVYVCLNVCPGNYDQYLADDDGGEDDDDDGADGDGDRQRADGGGGDRTDSPYDGPGQDRNKGLIYCCTLESFQRAYGPLDPIVFGQRDN